MTAETDRHTTAVANYVMTSPNFRQLLKLHGIDLPGTTRTYRNRFVLSHKSDAVIDGLSVDFGLCPSCPATRKQRKGQYCYTIYASAS